MVGLLSKVLILYERNYVQTVQEMSVSSSESWSFSFVPCNNFQMDN